MPSCEYTFSLLRGYVGWFYFLGVMTNVVMNTGVQIFL